jgi:hypothetical protein
MAKARKTQTERPRDVMLHVAGIQLASIAAASRFFAGWAQSADRYVQAVGGEVRARVHGQTDSAELAAGLATVTTEHLRELTALPNVAVRHFNRELTVAAPRQPTLTGQRLTSKGRDRSNQ